MYGPLGGKQLRAAKINKHTHTSLSQTERWIKNHIWATASVFTGFICSRVHLSVALLQRSVFWRVMWSSSCEESWESCIRATATSRSYFWVFMRNMHRAGSNLMTIVAALKLLQVIRKPVSFGPHCVVFLFIYQNRFKVFPLPLVFISEIAWLQSLNRRLG